MVYVPPKLGPFELLSRLGAGGMAETFVAVRRGPAGFAQRVCLKRILPAYADDQEFVRSFLDEAKTSAALRHANIVQVLDFAQAAGGHYLALELIDGLDLRALLQRGTAFDGALTTLIASEIGAALEHAHAHEEGRAAVVHRDISPSNVLVSRAGEVKLTDFGIARVVGGPHRTASGIIKGKVPYMPPEYIELGRFDTRGDLFSLGVLLFELLHGERPFDGDSELDTLRRIVSGERRPVTADAPAELVACIDRLLATAPEDRFPDARALLDALPQIPPNQARRRLGELVRAQASTSAHGAIVRASDISPLAPTVAASTSDARATVDGTETRTAPLKPPTRLARPALRALLGASAVCTLVAVVGLARLDSHASDHLQPPPTRTSPPTATQAVQPLAPATAALPTAAPGPVLPPSADAPPTSPPAPKPSESTQAPTPERQPSSELRVIVYPFGDVWVDDKYIGQSPLSLKVSPGTHTVAAGEGRARERRTIHVAAGEHARMLFQREPQPPH